MANIPYASERNDLDWKNDSNDDDKDDDKNNNGKDGNNKGNRKMKAMMNLATMMKMMATMMITMMEMIMIMMKNINNEDSALHWKRGNSYKNNIRSILVFNFFLIYFVLIQSFVL